MENEIVVDAYDAGERAMGWYYYLEDKIHFPFQAKCITAKVVSPLRKGEMSKYCAWHQQKSVPAICWS
jgi:hypothetical protein